MRLPWTRRQRRDEELTADLEAYVERETAEGTARGLDPEAARHAALRKLGNVTRVREEVHEMYSFGALEACAKDLRHAARLLRRSPGFALAAILSLALGIGANAAIFQLLDAIRLRSLPVARPNELAEVVIEGGTRGFGITNSLHATMTHPLWESLGRHQEAFFDLFAWGSVDFAVGRSTSHRVHGLWVSGNLFQALRLTPHRGRLVGPADDVRGCGAGPVVISHAYWTREFGRDEGAIGKPLVLDGRTFLVAGVAPQSFFGFEVGRTFDVAVPICAAGVWDPAVLDQRNFWWLVAMGHLKPGWTIARASAHLAGLSPGLFAATAPSGYDTATLTSWRALRLAATPAGRGVSAWREQYASSLWMLLALTGLVLVMACANLANLLLARGSTREREFAVRVAIGASRGRLVTQCLAESLLLAALGGVLGGWLAQALSRLLVSFVSTPSNPLELDLGADGHVLAFTAAVAVLTCLTCGLLPAWRASRADPQSAMKAGGRGLTAGRGRFSFQRLLIVAQVAVSVVLVVGAVLFVRSLQNLMTVDPGFRQDGILFGIVPLGTGDATTAAGVQAAREAVLTGVRALPQVESAASSTHIPLSGMSWGFGVRVPAAHGDRTGSSRFVWASPGYFTTMGTPLVSGRDFEAHDDAASRRVAVVNQAFVRQFLAGAPALGTLFHSLAEPGYPDTVYEIVGIVADTKYGGLRDESPPIAFVPVAQHPQPERWAWMLLALRTSAPVPEITRGVSRVLARAGVEGDVVMWPLRDQVREGLLRDRLMSWLSAFFGGLAVLLAALGIYGVMSYVVARRSHEMAIRMALGASGRDVLGLVLAQAGRLVAVGLGLGTLLVLGAGRAARAMLFGLQPTDPLAIAAGLTLLGAVALAAAWLPAARAAGIAPLDGLRAE